MTGPHETVDAEPFLPARLPAGTRVGSYVVDGWLRDGGMAALYRGHHDKTGARVAIKVQMRGDEDEATTAARFAREGEVMGRLSGAPNIVRVLDSDALSDGRRYVVTEWIEGDNLEELLDQIRNDDGVMSIERACRLVRDVALALEAAHQAKVVHRDVKPSNVMIDRTLADREIAKLLDFGISADLGAGATSEDLTATGVVLGTSGYMAPEQALGLPTAPAFDIYALGVVMFEAITGYAIPPGGLPPDRLPKMRQRRPNVPEELDALVAACVSRDPRQRPASAAEVAARLDGLVARPLGTETTSDPTRPGPILEATEPGEGRSLMLPVLVGVLVVGGALAWWLLRTPNGDRAASADEGASASVVLDVPSRQPATTPEPSDGSDDGTQASADLLAPGSSSGSEAESEAASATTTGEPDVNPSSVRPSPRPNCAEARAATEAAVARLDNVAVLRASSNGDCWTTPEQRIDRKIVRVQALSELGRYERCVKEGKGITDPRVARVTKLCRQRAEGPG